MPRTSRATVLIISSVISDEVTVIGVGSIELKHREFGIMPGGDALISEVSVDLVDPFESADQKPLEVQFGRDAEIQVHVQRVVMGPERPCRCAARNGLHHRRLDFEITPRIQKIADGLHDPGTQDKDLLDVGIDDQIDISLTVAEFHIGKAMPFFGKRSKRF